jgi:hypothetical protein
MKIVFILTVGGASEYFMGHFASSLFQIILLAVLYRAGFGFGATKQASADLQEHVSLGV